MEECALKLLYRKRCLHKSQRKKGRAENPRKSRSSCSKTTVLESLFKKFPGLKACNFVNKRLQYRCFTEKFRKFLRTPFLQNTSSGCFWKKSVKELVFSKILAVVLF